MAAVSFLGDSAEGVVTRQQWIINLLIATIYPSIKRRDITSAKTFMMCISLLAFHAIHLLI